MSYYFLDGTNVYPRFFLFYRIEQISDNTNSNSIWIDGNSNTGTEFIEPNSAQFSNIAPVNNINYYNPPDNTIVRTGASYNYECTNNNDLVATFSVIPFTSSYTTNINIYCRFGNSMAYNISYESVSLKLTP